MSRAAISGLLVLIYVIVFNLYIYLLANGFLKVIEARLFYYYLTGAMTLLSWADLKTITKNEYHIQFNTIAFLSLFANFILNILNYHSVFLADAPNMFMIFNGLIFANTIIVLICMKRHGFFKD